MESLPEKEKFTEEIILNPDEKLTLRGLIGLINQTINSPEFNRREVIRRRWQQWFGHCLILIAVMACKLSFLKYIPKANQHLFLAATCWLSILIPIRLMVASLCLLMHFKRRNGKLVFLRKTKFTHWGVFYAELPKKTWPKTHINYRKFGFASTDTDIWYFREYCIVRGLKWHLLKNLLSILESLPYCLIFLLM